MEVSHTCTTLMVHGYAISYSRAVDPWENWVDRLSFVKIITEYIPK